jgi:predicted nuclease of predicted toxin-antitoxin system
MNRITIEPGKRGGQPTIRGLRITVYDVLRMLADGADEAEILGDFPELETAGYPRLPCVCRRPRAQDRDAACTVKLLLDENLSRRMAPFLQDDFPGSSHVALPGLERAPDKVIWDHAKANGFVIVTSDADFEELSLLLRAPPHVVRLAGGNLSRTAILALLIAHAEAIHSRIELEGRACVEIVKPRV